MNFKRFYGYWRWICVSGIITFACFGLLFFAYKDFDTQLVHATDTTPPNSVTNLVGYSASGHAYLYWTASGSADLAGYDIYRSSTASIILSSYTKLNGGFVSATNYDDTTGSADTIYYYLVQAVDTSGNESELPDPVIMKYGKKAGLVFPNVLPTSISIDSVGAFNPDDPDPPNYRILGGDSLFYEFDITPDYVAAYNTKIILGYDQGSMQECNLGLRAECLLRLHKWIDREDDPLWGGVRNWSNITDSSSYWPESSPQIPIGLQFGNNYAYGTETGGTSSISASNVSPYDASTVYTLQPTLTVSGAGSNSTRWIISSTQNKCYERVGDVLDTNDDAVNKSSYTVGSGVLSESTTYYWRIITKTTPFHGLSTCTSFTTYTNTAPTAPTTLYAHDTDAQSGSVNPTDLTDTTPVFSAMFYDDNAGDVAKKARIQVSTDNSFASLTHWDSGSSGTTISDRTVGTRTQNITYGNFGTAPLQNLSTDDGNAIYYWRIKMWDEGGLEGAWSETASFQFANVPNAPTISSPANDSTGNITAPTITSSVYSGDLSHISSDWEIFSDSGYANLVWYKYNDSTNKISTVINNTNGSFSGSLSGYSKLKSYSSYWVRVRYTNGIGSSSWSGGIKFTTRNTSPLPPDSGFSPSGGTQISSQTPTISWIAGSDPDEDDTAGTLLYEVCVSASSTPSSSCTYPYTTNQGQVQVAVSDTLADETTYYYQVRTKDDSGDASSEYSSWSEVQSFSINTALEPALIVTKTVGINIATPSKKNKSSRLFQKMFFFQHAYGKNSFQAPGVHDFVLDIKISLVITLFMLASASIYVLLIVRKPLFILPSILYAPRTSFVKIADRKQNGTFGSSYYNYARKIGIVRKAVFIVTLFIILKVSMAIIFSIFAFESTSALEDNNKSVKPGDVLTYRIDWENIDDGPATSMVLTDTFPAGTQYQSGSALINGNEKTDASDSDEVTTTSTSISFSLGTIDAQYGANDSGYVLFRVVVINPNTETSISNTATYTYSESLGPLTTNTTTNPVTTYSISGALYNDVNSNALKDETESGSSNITVDLYHDSDDSGSLNATTDSLIATASSASTGTFEFTKIGPETYFVFIQTSTLPAGATLTSENSQKIVIESENKSNINFAYMISEDSDDGDGDGDHSSIGGTLWIDTNRDALQNNGENGIEEILVRLYKNNDSNAESVDTEKDTFIGSARTNQSGDFDFTGLASGDFFVIIDESSNNIQQKKYTLTTNNNPKHVYLSPGDMDYNDADFGYALPTSEIGNMVFLDENENAIYDSYENGMSDITLRLYQDSNSNNRLDSENDDLVETQHTDAKGQYAFQYVRSAQYFVMVEIPSSYVLTTNNNSLKVNITTDNGQSYHLADFGFKNKNTITETTNSNINTNTNSNSNANNNSNSNSNKNTNESAPMPDDAIPSENSNSSTNTNMDINAPLPDKGRSNTNINEPDDKNFLDDVTVDDDPIVNDGKSIQPTVTVDKSKQSNIPIKGVAKKCPKCETVLYVYPGPTVYSSSTDSEGKWQFDVSTYNLSQGKHAVFIKFQNKTLGINTSLFQLTTIEIKGAWNWKYFIVFIATSIVLVLSIILYKKEKKELEKKRVDNKRKK